MGVRSMTGALPFFQLKTTATPTVIETTNASGSSVVVMIETQEGIDSVEEIAAIPGVDMVLIGSNDLCIELGVPGEFRSDIFKNALEKVAAACKKNNKVMGLAGIYDQLDIHEWAVKDLGVRYMLCQQDSGLIAGAGAKCAAAIPKP
jgi:2-keto-3-deoxy-L-rhamnonate aldolase RhmA